MVDDTDASILRRLRYHSGRAVSARVDRDPAAAERQYRSCDQQLDALLARHPELQSQESGEEPTA